MRTYGRCWKEKGEDCDWIKIETDPNVIMRLKRCFQGVDKSALHTVKISLSPEHATDVLWFFARYPMKLKEEFREELEKLSNKFREKIVTLEEILGDDYKGHEFKLAMPLRQYQRVGAELILKNGFALITDDVGLGKTALAIGTMSDPRTLPAIVVTLTHLPDQWQKEVAKFMPELNCHILKGTTPYEFPLKDGRKPDVIITNYHKLGGWAEALAKYGRSIIFDEAHELRHNDSTKYQSAKLIAEKMKFCTGLTATPIFNYGGEIYNVVDCLKPGAMGEVGEFMREWCTSYLDGKWRIGDPKAFGAYLREQFIMLRRTKADVGRELPPVQKIIYPVESDNNALAQIESSAVELARIILGRAEQFKGQRMQAAGKLDSLIRQATGISKALSIADFTRMVVESGRKAVLFLWHREVIEIIMERLKDLHPALYTGTESVGQKEESKRRFIAGDTPLIIISNRAGAGLDGLQHVCDTAIVGELDYSPSVHIQNIGRVARDGQKNPVTAYFLVSDGGSDPLLIDILGIKDDQLSGINDPDADIIKPMEVDPDHVKKLAQSYLARSARVEAEVSLLAEQEVPL